jgi:predicted nucleic acid-binding Zn finger protein
MVLKAAVDVCKDWKSDFLSFVSERLEQIEKDYQMESMDDISKSLFANRSDIMGQAALALIEKKFGHLLDQQYCQCPHCLGQIKARSKKVKREIQILVGTVTLYRPYFYCNSCQFGFYPLDEALGLSKRKIQPDIQELEAWLAAEMPYETSSETLDRCAGIKISNHHIHDVANEIVQDLQILDVCPGKEEIQRQIDTISEGKLRRPILMIGLDGAHAPTRPEPSARKGPRGKGEWKEVKGFRLYLLDSERIIHLISWHQIKSDKELAADLLRVKQAALIPEEKVRICVIGDGAPWIWNRIEEIFPDAKMVLDYYHCSEYLYDTAHAQYGKNSQKAQEWVEATLTRLFSNNIEQIIAGIKRMKPSSDAAKEQIDKTIGYLSERTDKLEYGKLKRGGYQIGSGGIESSNKFISNVRLKRSGAWWYPTNANNILKLRCAKYNGTFDRIMTEAKRKNKPIYSQKEIGVLRLVVDNS